MAGRWKSGLSRDHGHNALSVWAWEALAGRVGTRQLLDGRGRQDLRGESGRQALEVAAAAANEERIVPATHRCSSPETQSQSQGMAARVAHDAALRKSDAPAVGLRMNRRAGRRAAGETGAHIDRLTSWMHVPMLHTASSCTEGTLRPMTRDGSKNASPARKRSSPTSIVRPGARQSGRGKMASCIGEGSAGRCSRDAWARARLLRGGRRRRPQARSTVRRAPPRQAQIKGAWERRCASAPSGSSCETDGWPEGASKPPCRVSAHDSLIARASLRLTATPLKRQSQHAGAPRLSRAKLFVASHSMDAARKSRRE